MQIAPEQLIKPTAYIHRHLFILNYLLSVQNDPSLLLDTMDITVSIADKLTYFQGDYILVKEGE